ncbi:DOMON-like domain-containing protein [Trichocoleus sp. FACHB-262]|uniref:DOMON-like domain-containing protein n=1 Tax=Trichocoleus sp. FACHB-262 TaxID=2692869 RepID=UPI0016836728|nr:DOMON-like domain-containing protein [Trichocoleus sp. FACHB-262]MBD2120805.1 DOMON-like domain-containing protein [Trichocoleus sp. FACHB-262]
MNSKAFSLQPFPHTNSPANLQLTGDIARRAQTLHIRYVLSGDLSKIAIAAPSDSPTRKHELWQETCFELFLGLQDSDRYWEFNLSPSGDWNVYRFDGYRQGMQEETAFTVLPSAVETQPEAHTLSLELNLAAIASDEKPLDVAITAVVKTKDSEVTYWALAHTGSEADFHRRDSFVLNI